MLEIKKLPRHPHKLFDFLIENFDLKNDKRLCLEIGIQPSSLSKFRAKKRAVTPALILAIHDRFQIPIEEIKNKL
jgi:hypothetical protein